MPTPRKSRPRRFALPDHGADERVDEAIEAFLQGPEVRRHRPPARRRPRKSYPNSGSKATGDAATAKPASTSPTGDAAAGSLVQSAESRPHVVTVRPVTDIRTIPGRLEFFAALERESLRAARYARPASVAIVELVPERPNQAIDLWLRTLAGPVARSLRGDTRVTDLVARVANARFQVLLPETPEAGAGRFAERVSSTCQSSIDATGAPVAVRVTVATSTPDHSLQEALQHALQAIEAA